MFRRSRPAVRTLVCILLIAAASQLGALVEPDGSSPVAEKAYSHPELDVAQSIQRPSELPGKAATLAAGKLAALGMPADRGRLDARTGRWATLLASEPMLPGKGVGNELNWELLKVAAPQSDAALERAAMNAFVRYLGTYKQALQIEPTEIAASYKVTIHRGGDVVQIYAPRVYKGVRVRDSYVSGSINHGNLILFGAHNWGDISLSVEPKVFFEDAAAAVQSHLGSTTITGAWGKAELNIVPTARGFQLKTLQVGSGLGHRLAWVLRPSVAGDMGRWEALVDAHTGELLSFADTNHYVATPRRVQGGVLPVSNDGISPDGVEQAGWPMPSDIVQTPGGPVTTDSGGNLPAPVDGNITSNLSGEFVNINDNCGAISLTSSGDIDFGTSAGTDCTTPGFGGAGNTHASRTGFHELNRLIEMAQSHVPGNAWLQQTLTSNMNINLTCNAFWSPSAGTVNFYRSGGGCFNTGEIAGVFDHEWGHGYDDNDAIPTIASPSGEGVADIYAAIRLNTSCIGRNFRATVCSGFGDPCLTCTGVRDIDYLKRASGQPHDYSWSNANCGGSVHCVGGVYAEAVWSLWKRKLQSSPYNLSDHTAHEVVNRLTFIGASSTGTWFSGGPPNGGCAGTSGYMNYLAADDDNGNLNDGTPHMGAIFAAFDDQEIACGTPTVQDSGCGGTPTTAPVVTASPLDKSVSLSWGAVTGATSYEVFRTDGVFACDFGKVRAGETTGTSFNDSGLQNGRDYSYVVIPKGSSAACFGTASACATVAPVAGPNLDVDAGSAVLGTSGGDADPFIDNCETGTLTFDVANTGIGSLTNVRITGVTVVSPAGTTVTSSFPAAVSPSTLGEGAAGSGSFDFDAAGLSFGDTLVFEVSVTSDELFPTVKTQSVSLADAESDLLASASKTWDFETDLDGWTLIQGTFNQTTAGGGAGGSAGYVASSANLDNQCDQVRSPAFRLTATSTMTLENNYEIENFSSGQWWDRANIAFFEGGARNSVDPDGGRLYNASGAGATCVTAGQNGWANLNGTWGSSSWSAGVLGSAGRAGQTVQLDVGYGTDPAANGKGFWFDRVTVTDVEELVPDGQSDTCGPPPCGDAFCDPATEDQCSCPADCGTPPGSETPNVDCNDGDDNDCDGNADCADADCSSDPACQVTCDNDGICEAGEDCNNCPNDCISGTSSGAVCGNGVCEAGNGEDCLSCPSDCNGTQSGKPSNRFCCGDGAGQNPVSCGDSRCTQGAFDCTDVPVPSGSYCCGDATCEGAEDSFNCEIDCGPPPCGDAFCDPATEDQCSCAVDCGTPPGSEAGMCTDGVDNDCGGGTDCNDTDCGSDPACQCLPKNASCSLDSECCSLDCKNNGRCR